MLVYIKAKREFETNDSKSVQTRIASQYNKLARCYTLNTESNCKGKSANSLALNFSTIQWENKFNYYFLFDEDEGNEIDRLKKEVSDEGKNR